MHIEGRGVPQDYKLAVDLARRSCEGGYPTGCVNLGFLYERGWGVAADRDRAIQLYKQACDAGEAVGCQNLQAAQAQ